MQTDGAFKEIDRDRLLTKLNGCFEWLSKIAFVRTGLPKYDFVTDQQEWHYKCLIKKNMRKSLVDEILKQMEVNKDIFFITGTWVINF